MGFSLVTDQNSSKALTQAVAMARAQLLVQERQRVRSGIAHEMLAQERPWGAFALAPHDALKPRGCAFDALADGSFVLRCGKAQDLPDATAIEGLLRGGREGLLATCRGAFSLVVYSVQAEKLYVIADRLGLQPIYYATSKSGFLIASSLRAFSGSGVLPLRLAAEGWAKMLVLGAILQGETTLAGVQLLAPGSLLEIDLKRNAPSIRNWWEPWQALEPALFREHLEAEIAAWLKEPQLLPASPIELVVDPQEEFAALDACVPPWLLPCTPAPCTTEKGVLLLLQEDFDSADIEAAFADIPNLDLWKSARAVFRADVVRDMHAALAALKRQLKARARVKENWLMTIELQRSELFTRARLAATYFDEQLLIGTSACVSRALVCYDRSQRHSVQEIATRLLAAGNAKRGVGSWLRGLLAERGAQREALQRAHLDQRTLDRLCAVKLEDSELNVDGLRSALSRVRTELDQVEDELRLLWWWSAWRKALAPNPQE